MATGNHGRHRGGLKTRAPPPGKRRLLLDETAAQAVVLVRAVEASDRRCRLLGREARRSATRDARRAADDDLWPARRARTLAAELAAAWPFLPRLQRITDPARHLLAPAVVLAFASGLATNALGPERHVHVLALPLLAILAWNVAVLLFLAVRRWLPLGAAAWRGPRPRLLDALEVLAGRAVARLPLATTADEGLIRDALAAYLRAWFPTVAPLAAARLRRTLHLAALALVVGVVAGMYLRGVAFAYRATWESTFLAAGAVDRLLGAILGPAAALLGTEVPEAAAIESPASDDAALWIHLWALTAALFAGLPRLLLAAADAVRAARLQRRLPVLLDEVYLRRLEAAASSSTERVDVLPYSYRPAAAVTDALRARLLDVFGAASDLRFHAPLEYGAAPGAASLAGGRAWVVVFNLAQTPELEVHAELLRTLREEISDGATLVPLVDGSVLRGRLPGGEAGERRFKERRRSWDRAARAAGLEALHLDLRRDDADDAVARLLAAVRPSEDAG